MVPYSFWVVPGILGGSGGALVPTAVKLLPPPPLKILKTEISIRELKINIRFYYVPNDWWR